LCTLAIRREKIQNMKKCAFFRLKNFKTKHENTKPSIMTLLITQILM
jgi:hypothetical protein